MQWAVHAGILCDNSTSGLVQTAVVVIVIIAIIIFVIIIIIVLICNHFLLKQWCLPCWHSRRWPSTTWSPVCAAFARAPRSGRSARMSVTSSARVPPAAGSRPLSSVALASGIAGGMPQSWSPRLRTGRSYIVVVKILLTSSSGE